MGVNKEEEDDDDDDGSGDSWNRNSKPGGMGDFHRVNYIGIEVVLVGLFLLLLAMTRP